MGPAGLCVVCVIGGSRRNSYSFAYQYHRPSGTVKYRHDEVEREKCNTFSWRMYKSKKEKKKKKKKGGRTDGWEESWNILRRSVNVSHQRAAAILRTRKEKEEKWPLIHQISSVHHWRICHQTIPRLSSTISSHPIPLECQGLLCYIASPSLKMSRLPMYVINWRPQKMKLSSTISLCIIFPSSVLLISTGAAERLTCLNCSSKVHDC